MLGVFFSIPKKAQKRSKLLPFALNFGAENRAPYLIYLDQNLYTTVLARLAEGESAVLLCVESSKWYFGSVARVFVAREKFGKFEFERKFG